MCRQHLAQGQNRWNSVNNQSCQWYHFIVCICINFVECIRFVRLCFSYHGIFLIENPIKLHSHQLNVWIVYERVRALSMGLKLSSVDIILYRDTVKCVCIFVPMTLHSIDYTVVFFFVCLRLKWKQKLISFCTYTRHTAS